ncbi:MAG: DUF2309 domain-containing protein [Acidiferrobacteraceae bacterium]
MSLSLGRRLRIRAMAHVAGEPISYFWPMRTFIHHNPLQGLEHLPFAQAVAEGKRLFHGRGFLPRHVYQGYLAQGKVDCGALESMVARFVAEQPSVGQLALPRLLMTLLTELPQPLGVEESATGPDVHATLHGLPLPRLDVDAASLAAAVKHEVLAKRPLYAAVDQLFCSRIGDTLDELVIKSCLDFFDEGQSMWQMPGREKGLFASWSAVARHNLRLFIRGLHIKNILAQDETPEGIISYVMGELGIPEDAWIDYFTGEFIRLHGWTGFIRWRASAKNYHWSRNYPADLVDYLALRLVLALALLREHATRMRTPANLAELTQFIERHPEEAYLRHEFFSGGVLPAMASVVEDAILARRQAQLRQLLPEYLTRKRGHVAGRRAAYLKDLVLRAGLTAAFDALGATEIGELLDILARFEAQEGMMWLNAHEAAFRGRLLAGLNRAAPIPAEKRPFAQAMFCIDVRSERIRRHLEKVGDYQTFGIAGFFGVPVSFVGLEKGSETHLCPVVVTPKNLVLELSIATQAEDQAFVSVLEQIFHELKASLLSPYVTVEAIGLLFGLDMFGRSLSPVAYNRWRQRLHGKKGASRLLLDKLSREQADSIIRALQRAMIVKAVGRDLGVRREAITDEMVRELRETALGHCEGTTGFARQLGLDALAESRFIERLRRIYRVNRGYAQLQMEQLGRIGFTLDEQVHFVSTALRSIGLTEGFSRFVLLVGHGSTSENNPYESALDCGACGGNHGISNARILAQMANKPAVRERLRAQGIRIADDAWFVPALHNTTTDELRLHDLDLLPPSHLVYAERLSNGLVAATRLCAAERMATLGAGNVDPSVALSLANRNSIDWSQVRPEWGLSGNAAMVIGRRHLTESMDLEGRVFLQSYDYRCDPKGRLLENILTGPLVVGQWINMEHYFSVVDNEHYGSGSKVYHNVAGRFAVMTGNLSDLRTGLPAQTVLRDGRPYHEPLRLLAVIEAPIAHAGAALEGVAQIRSLALNGWLHVVVADPETGILHLFANGGWHNLTAAGMAA